jgi:hypothetical protein
MGAEVVPAQVVPAELILALQVMLVVMEETMVLLVLVFQVNNTAAAQVDMLNIHKVVVVQL